MCMRQETKTTKKKKTRKIRKTKKNTKTKKNKKNKYHEARLTPAARKAGSFRFNTSPLVVIASFSSPGILQGGGAVRRSGRSGVRSETGESRRRRRRRRGSAERAGSSRSRRDCAHLPISEQIRSMSGCTSGSCKPWWLSLVLLEWLRRQGLHPGRGRTPPVSRIFVMPASMKNLASLKRSTEDGQ